MKKLTLVRHAKSSWEFPHLSDFERPLNPRGHRDLPALAERIAEFGLYPDLIISSGAVRALDTAEVIADRLRQPAEYFTEIPELYESCYETLLNTLQNMPDQHRHIMLIGHNPGLQDLGYYLTHESLAKFPTAALMHIHLSITSWCELAESCGTLELFDYPKKHCQKAQVDDH